MVITPYVSVDGLHFGSSEDEAVSRFGSPLRVHINRDGEREFHYSGFVLRFDASDSMMRECSFIPFVQVSLEGERLEWTDEALTRLQSMDGDLKEVLGFVISLRLGVALSGFHDGQSSERAIHAFRSGDWDMFKAKMVDFRFHG